MKKLSYLFIIVFIFSIFSIPVNTSALSCVEPLEPLEALKEADTVLIGTVKEIKEGTFLEAERTKTIILEVKDVFKGNVAKELKIKEDFTWGTSELHKTYLYYLKKENGSFVNPLCSATTSNLEESNAFIKEEVIIQEPVSKSEKNTNAGGFDWGYIVGPFVIFITIIILVRSIQKIRHSKK